VSISGINFIPCNNRGDAHIPHLYLTHIFRISHFSPSFGSRLRMFPSRSANQPQPVQRTWHNTSRLAQNSRIVVIPPDHPSLPFCLTRFRDHQEKRIFKSTLDEAGEGRGRNPSASIQEGVRKHSAPGAESEKLLRCFSQPASSQTRSFLRYASSVYTQNGF